MKLYDIAFAIVFFSMCFTGFKAIYWHSKYTDAMFERARFQQIADQCAKRLNEADE